MPDENRRTVLLHPEHWAAVERKAAEIGSPGNTSAGLRALIAEYGRNREAVFDLRMACDAAIMALHNTGPVAAQCRQAIAKARGNDKEAQ